MFAAGCHNNNSNSSGYGRIWATVTDNPGDYTSYVTTITSVTLTDTLGNAYSAISVPEPVDFTQLSNFAEMWGVGAVPIGTYTEATITLSYLNAAIYVMVNGQPQKATILDYATKGVPSTYSVNIKFDPLYPLNVTSTYASTSALRLAIDFNLAASGTVDLSTSPATVYVRPVITAGLLTPDTKVIRVRGPVVNSSAVAGPGGTYTAYVRPFYDEANNIGTIALFNQDDTVWTINGATYVGAEGLTALSKLSAGVTMAAGWTQFVPDYNPANQAYAGTFDLLYVVAASSLEDNYSEGISGDVVARVGDTLYLQGATLFLNTANTFAYEPTLSRVLVGPATIVTADDNTTLTGLTADSISVGQFIHARGVYSVLINGAVQIDATGNSGANTGAVRMLATPLYGTLVSSTANSVVMDLQVINNWPVSNYTFTGSGANPALYSVSTTGLTLPSGTVPPDPVWVNGFTTTFGASAPNLTAVALNDEKSVQLAGTPLGGASGTPPGPGTLTCGIGSQICEPASYQVWWSTPTISPFTSSTTSSEFFIDLANTVLGSALIRIGGETIDAKTLAASPKVVPTTAAATNVFSPLYMYGNPVTATSYVSLAGVSTASTTFLNEFSDYSTFWSGLEASINTANPASQMEARGVYDRATNTFTATSIDFVL